MQLKQSNMHNLNKNIRKKNENQKLRECWEGGNKEGRGSLSTNKNKNTIKTKGDRYRAL